MTNALALFQGGIATLILAILALFNGPYTSWGIGEWICLAIAVAGGIGILIIVLRVMEVEIPPWAWKIFWIVVLCLVAIFAVRLIFSM